MLAVSAAEPNRTSGASALMAAPPVGAPIDANGNLTGDGTRIFEWDARNQLVAVNVGPHRSEFAYDGNQRRVRVIEKEGGVVQSDTKVIWCQTAICEERAADGVAVTRRLFTRGEQVDDVARSFAGDHLGSVTDVTDTLGGSITRYAFDPWGRRAVTSGMTTTNIGFTGHETNAATGLSLALYRAYDAELGRWLSEDPLGFIDGPNVYSYVKASPVRSRDALGLWAGGAGGGLSGGVAAGLFGAQGNADCSVVVDGTGNIGMLCCASAGPAYGLAVQGGLSGKGTFCKGCQSICDLEGPSISVGGGLGPGGASGSFGKSAPSVSVSVGPRGGLGGYVGFGPGGCKLILQRRPCDSCGSKK